jgi:uncharacterized BrkB/YihY/UPF0761 family membrane protein
MLALISAVDSSYDVTKSRVWWRARLVSIGASIGTVVWLAAAVGLAQLLGTDGALVTSLIVPVSLYIGLMVLYRHAPNREPPAWRKVVPGATFAFVGVLITSAVLTLYVTNFGHYNETYGVLGAAMVMLLWLFFGSLVILVGAELNAAFELSDDDARPENVEDAFADENDDDAPESDDDAPESDDEDVSESDDEDAPDSDDEDVSENESAIDLDENEPDDADGSTRARAQKSRSAQVTGAPSSSSSRS